MCIIIIIYRSIVVINHIASNKAISNDSSANKHGNFTTSCKLQCSYVDIKIKKYKVHN